MTIRRKLGRGWWVLRLPTVIGRVAHRNRWWRCVTLANLLLSLPGWRLYRWFRWQGRPCLLIYRCLRCTYPKNIVCITLNEVWEGSQVPIGVLFAWGGERARACGDWSLGGWFGGKAGSCLWLVAKVCGSIGCTFMEDVWYMCDSFPVWWTDVGGTLVTVFCWEKINTCMVLVCFNRILGKYKVNFPWPHLMPCYF